MKNIFILLLIITNLSAFMANIKTFSANFTQSILDGKHITIKYRGTIKAKVPNMVKWNYLKPIQKEVIVRSGQVTIIEPEIEQVIITRIDKAFAFFTILKNAKKINSNHYISFYNKIKINLFLKKGQLKSISYLDQLQNKVTIVFTNQSINKSINNKIFNVTIPSNYDIVTR